jgi:fructokinase
MPKIFAIGETVYDIIFKDGKPVTARAGGSMLNSAVSLGRLGLDVYLVSDMGSDMVGDEIDLFLRNNGVNTGYIQRYPNLNSAIALAFLDDSNNARYNFYRNFPAERLTGLDIHFEQDDIILFGSFFALATEIRPVLKRILVKANEAGCIIIYDPNFRKPHLHELEKLLPFIIENIRFADLVRGSDEDFQLIFGTAVGEEVFRIISGEGCNNLVYTANKNGAEVFSQGIRMSFEVPEIKIVSSIGAGDNFNAGIIWSLVSDAICKRDFERIHEKTWENLIRNGIDFASEVCGSYDNYISYDFALRKSDIG